MNKEQRKTDESKATYTTDDSANYRASIALARSVGGV